MSTYVFRALRLSVLTRPPLKSTVIPFPDQLRNHWSHLLAPPIALLYTTLPIRIQSRIGSFWNKLPTAISVPKSDHVTLPLAQYIASKQFTQLRHSCSPELLFILSTDMSFLEVLTI